MALMAAMPIAQGAKTKTFTRENVNITGLWEKDEVDDGWLHLDLRQLPGLPNGLSAEMTWVVNFVIKNHEDALRFGSDKRTDDWAGVDDRTNFSVRINPRDSGGRRLDVNGYGWGEGSGWKWFNYTLYPSKGYDLVWNPDGYLNSERYGDIRDKVGFFWSGTANASGDSGTMFYRTATDSLGPDETWQGLTDLYASTQDTEDTSWLQVTVSYSYEVIHENEYVVGGKGELLADTNGLEEGGPGLYELYRSDSDDYDGTELCVADQYGVGDDYGATVGQLYGEQHGEDWNKLCFMAEGTQRRFQESLGNPDQFKPDGDPDGLEPDPEEVRVGNAAVGQAGDVTADFNMYLGGIVVSKNTGNYTLIAPNFFFGGLEDADDAIRMNSGGSSTFTLQAKGDGADDPVGVIDWGKEGNSVKLYVAAGKTLVLKGKGENVSGADLSGGGTVRITDETIFGSSGDIYVYAGMDWSNPFSPGPSSSGGTTFDLGGKNLQEPSEEGGEGRTVFLYDGSNLANAGELTASVQVFMSGKSGSSDLGGLRGDYLGGVDMTYAGKYDPSPQNPNNKDETWVSRSVTGLANETTVQFTTQEDGTNAFKFVVGTGNITTASQGSAPSGGAYLLRFNGADGKLDFEEGAKVELYLTNDVIKQLQDKRDSSYVDLWFSNGSFSDLEGMSALELQEWFESHFSFSEGIQMGGTKNQKDFYDILSGDSGILRLVLSADGIWMASSLGDIKRYQLEETLDTGAKKWARVIVDKDMALSFTDDQLSPPDSVKEVTLVDLSAGIDAAGEGGVLTIRDDRAAPEEGEPLSYDLVVRIDQEKRGNVASGLRGLTVEDDTITVIKEGDQDLLIWGDFTSKGKVEVAEGKLYVGGDLKDAKEVTVTAGELDIQGNIKDVGEVEVSEGKIVVNGWESSIAKLGDFGNGESEAELVINGALTITDASTPGGNGTISGSGILIVKNKLEMHDNRLDGVAVWLDKNEEGYGTIVLGKSDKISGLFSGDYSADQTLASGEVNDGMVKLKATLTIDSTGSNVRMADFYGTFDETSAGGGIVVTGSVTCQMLRSEGGDGIGLTVQNGGYLALAGRGAEKTDHVQEARYGTVSVREGSTLAVQANGYGADYATVTQLNADSVSVSKSGTLEVLYNLAAVGGDFTNVGPAIVTDKFAWGEGAKLFVGTMGFDPYGVSNQKNLDSVIIKDRGEGWDIEGLEDGQELELELGGSFLIYWKNVKATYLSDRGGVVLSAEANFDNIFSGAAANKQNSLAGADMLWAARQTAPMTSQTEMLKMMVWAANNLQSNPEKVAQTLAGVAGSAAPILGTAQRDALRSQMLRMRDRAGMMGLDESYAYESLPYTHFWVEATGDFINVQDGDDYEPGYTYNAWGGTLGLEMDVTENASVAAGITALYGNLDGGCADTADGNLDSYYLSLMGRFTRRRWGHTLVGVLGLNQAKLTRTVNYGDGFYRAHGSTSGWVAGLLYEATYDIPLDMEQTRIVQPLFAASVMKTNMRGYEESGLEGQGVGLNVGEQDWTTTTLAIGARYITSVGEEAFNRTAQLELRANIAQDFGDSQGEVSTSLQALPSLTRSVKGAEVGKTALQLGASLRVPISDQTLIYFNAGADIRDAMTAWNLGVGARYDF